MGLSDGRGEDAAPTDNTANGDSSAEAAADATEEDGEANADLPEATAEEAHRRTAADAKAQAENLPETGWMNPANPSVNAVNAMQTNCSSTVVRPGTLPIARRADGAASSPVAAQPAARPMLRGGTIARRASVSRRDEKRRRVQRKLDR